MSEKQKFQEAWDKESALTLKVLKSYPQEKTELKPHPTCRSAKDLAWTFVFEGVAGSQAVQGEMKFPPPNMPPKPSTVGNSVSGTSVMHPNRICRNVLAPVGSSTGSMGNPPRA